MKAKFAILSIILVVALQSCKKDLTTGIVGKYTSGSGSNYTEIIVTKVNENTIAVNIDNILLFNSTKMNNATSFTLNTYSEDDNGTMVTYSGSGTYSANNISLSVKADYGNGNIYSEVFSGTK